ncbi:MAG: rhodanese-like domain-containing protein [Planctomycetia bacterium]
MSEPIPNHADLAPEELKARIDAGESVFILDVRNPDEFAFCRLPGSHLIPLPELGLRLRELDPQREIVVHCRSGGRSAKAAELLRQNGFQTVRNLTGGILAWSARVDPSVPTY